MLSFTASIHSQLAFTAAHPQLAPSFRKVQVALRGAAVTASDISASMVKEAERRFNVELASGAKAPATAPVWEAKDLESATGQFDTVTCLDVMIHYPQVIALHLYH